MTEPGIFLLGPEARFRSLGLFAGVAGANLYAAGDAAPECTSCHEQGQKLAKSAHAALACDTCHESHEKFPTPRISPNRPAPPATPTRRATTTRASTARPAKDGNEGAPDCALCHGSAHELLPPKSQAFRSGGSRYLRHVPHRGGRAVPRQRARPGAGPRHHAGAAVHRLPRRTQDPQAHQRRLPGECRTHPRHLRKLPRRRPADAQVRPAQRPAGQLRCLVPRPGRQEPARRPWPTAPVATACTTSCRRPTPSRMVNAKNLPKTCGKCHPGAGTRFAISQVHVAEGRTEPGPPVGAPVLPADHSRDHRPDDAAQRRRLDPQADPPALPGAAHGAAQPRAARRSRGPHAALRTRAARGAGHLLPDPGLDRLRAEVSRPVVGAPAAAAGRHALHAQPDPSRGGRGLHRRSR